MNGAHPNVETITAYLLGSLTANEWKDIDTHVMGCGVCQSQAETLELRSDAFLTGLRGLRQAPADDLGLPALLTQAVGRVFPPTAKLAPAASPVLAVPPPNRGGTPSWIQAAAPTLAPFPAPVSAPSPVRAPKRTQIPTPNPTIAPATAQSSKLMAGHEPIRELFRGGLGVIYLVRHPVLKDLRAVKRPLAVEGFERDILLARFVREVQAVGSLRHDHVIRAMDAGTDDDGPFLVMEYLNGEPLSRLISRHGRLSVAAACELIRQAAIGLRAAHNRGLVHRDVKPSNLMLARANAGARIVVIDWGLVKQAGEHAVPRGEGTAAGIAMGTPDFIAPEQISDARAADNRADVYSLGVTPYSLLAGQAPFRAKPDLEKLIAHQREPFPPLTGVRADVPKELLTLITRMTERDPTKRLDSMTAVAGAMEEFACGPDSPKMLGMLEPNPLGDVAVPIDSKNTLNEMTQIPTSQIVGRIASAIRPSTMVSMSQMANEATVLSLSLTPAAPNRGRRRLLITTAVAAGALAVGVSIVAFRGKDSKESESSDAPRVLITEDFHSAYERKQVLPDGWSGDAFRIVDDNGKQCLEVSKPKGEHFVTLPPVALRGNFMIEAAYIMGNPSFATYHYLAFILESSKGADPLPLIVDWEGKITIADDPRAAPPNYKPLLPTRVRVTREGKKLSISLNDEIVATKDLRDLVEFDQLRIGMPGGAGNSGRLERLYLLKVATLK